MAAGQVRGSAISGQEQTEGGMDGEATTTDAEGRSDLRASVSYYYPFAFYNVFR